MYDDREIAISRQYLDRVLDVIDGPVALMGGWAVYLKVNEILRFATSGSVQKFRGSIDIHEIDDVSRIMDVDVDILKNGFTKMLGSLE